MYSLPQSYNQTSKCKRCICPNAYISFKDNLSNDDLCIVSDTEPDTEHPNGFILSIEKDGYLRHGKLLRRAEVIIVKN